LSRITVITTIFCSLEQHVTEL